MLQEGKQNIFAHSIRLEADGKQYCSRSERNIGHRWGLFRFDIFQFQSLCRSFKFHLSEHDKDRSFTYQPEDKFEELASCVMYKPDIMILLPSHCSTLVVVGLKIQIHSDEITWIRGRSFDQFSKE